VSGIVTVNRRGGNGISSSAGQKVWYALLVRPPRRLDRTRASRRISPAMSDEKDIQDVMHDEMRAARGKPPVHTVEADKVGRIKAGMVAAMHGCSEAEFINCVLDLGHAPGSEMYERMMKAWNQRPVEFRDKK